MSNPRSHTRVAARGRGLPPARRGDALRASQVHHAQLQQQLSEVRATERSRLAQLVHDDLGQYLVAIRAQLALLGLTSDATMQPAIGALAQNCQALQDGFRRLLDDLPADPDDLREALCALATRWQRNHTTACRVQLPAALPRLSAAQVRSIGLLVQEALTNVARHAEASAVRIRLSWRGRYLYLLLGDNGSGALTTTPGLGLRSMTQRAEELGGELHIARRQGRGWTLLLCLPVEHQP